MPKKFTEDSLLILAINYIRVSLIEYLYFFVLIENAQFQLCFCLIVKHTSLRYSKIGKKIMKVGM